MKKNDIEKRSEQIMELCMDIQQEVRRLKNQYGKQLTGRRTAYNEEERTLF